MTSSAIVSAVLKEIKYFLDNEGTYLFDTQLEPDKLYALPLIIFDLGEASESARLPGNGITRLDYDLSFRVYNFEANAFDSDDSGYSASLIDWFDNIRQHFENEVWLTADITNLTTNYAFRMEFQGMNKAEPILQNENLVLGYKFNFASISVDQVTSSYVDMVENAFNATGTVVFVGV